MSTPNDLQALFASIKPRPSPSQDAQPSQFPQGLRQTMPYEAQNGSQPQQSLQQHGYHNPSVSSPIFSPGPTNTPPHRSADVLSPNVSTPRGDQRQPSSDQTINLLNLLKFKQNTPTTSATQAPQQPSPAMGLGQSKPHPTQETGGVTAGRRTQGPSPPLTCTGEGSAAADTQEMLLRLLNRPKPAQSPAEEPAKPAPQQAVSTPPPVKSPEEKRPTDVETTKPTESAEAEGKEPRIVFGSSENKDSIPFEPPQPTPPKGTIFTYVNPFEQLAAASPRNRTPQPKSRSRSGSPAVEAVKSRKETTRVSNNQTKEAVSTSETSTQATPASSDENLKQPQPERKKETVSEALGEMAGQLDREVDNALNRADEKESARTKADQEKPSEDGPSAAEQAQAPAAEVKKELDKKENEVLDEIVPEPFTEPAKEAAAEGTLADSWESVEDSAEKEDERVVRVLNFPLKPFISITVKPYSDKLPSLRDDGIMDVARLKKDFDQLDRCLTSATSEYIVYALAKNGGLRIIRQDDGRDKQVFRSTRDRIFNVSLCTTATTSATATKEQAVLAIGVSGTVYWAPILRGDQDLFEMDALESESLVFPPYPASDENTSGGQLKTRAKRSSRHPEFFGIGRGKNIYIVPPHFAATAAYGVSGSQRTVDTEKFFKERTLKISTGKAGKDFTFSEDDTVVASLDKTGRLRFWDIREMTPTIDTGSTPSEVRVPLNTFVTGSPSEKSWPTSVLFIDKLRPYVKGIALRYVLVGLKQNHTLQLWDIGLGKAVQELNFPHENESDAICSVAYHPGSGIIVVGHPTRNSIYFVHLSAPRYNLQPMSQASFIKRAHDKDGHLPKPESTACLSGIREISFASKGQLRSLDILPISKPAGAQRNLEDEIGLFELYVMHSRGVTCLNIKKEDLGWTADNKIIKPVNALEEGYIEVTDLQTFPSYVADEPSVNGDAVATPQKGVVKDVAKKTSELGVDSLGPSRNESPAKVSPKKVSEEQVEVTTTGVDKAGKKKKKEKVKEANGKVTAAQTAPSSAAEIRTASPSRAAQPTKDEEAILPEQAPTAAAMNGPPEAASLGISGDLVKQIEKGVSGEVVRNLGRELDGLHKRFDEERRAWDAASAAKQDQVLRLVSSTLSDNVEKNLARIISQSIENDVVPAIVNTTSSTLNKQLNEAVSKQLSHAIPRELRQALPDTVSRAIQQPDVLNTISDMVGRKLASHVESEFSKVMHSSITPTIKNAVLRSTEKLGVDLERQVQAQLKQYEAQRQSDAAKIDQLTTLVKGLSDTVASMAAAQTGFQNEILRLNRQLLSVSQQHVESESRRASQQQAAPPAGPSQVFSPRTPEETELAEIAQLMNEGRYEEASVKWLQSSQQADLFDNLFVRLNPAYLTGLSPIVALSVGVAVTTSLQTNVAERLSWLEVVLQTVDLRDPDIREVAPRIMDILIQRLESLYMSIAENNPHDPVVRRIPPLSRRARELRGH
ncbi:hypothetical protein T310_5478 [Rasamsonia emersonii CBS 393.64]|uniref:EDC4-like protein pdc1 beta-propeller domain-containing protein n=1 Tax=Rasamsonia emersonii (strain ATCC 16479 / CBS 393.64 / IMI 116815) TaxID=1408163 RepID=A0A0F4YQV6_RASE3|nr:hypothetical protein T310_5478 [Rasamsonia emersonii CBS 393.64]KKA20490.1 hypothetical protein T310_5478 [Rasamsonia emersonii CBS 393.64]